MPASLASDSQRDDASVAVEDDEVARVLHDVAELVEHASTPAPPPASRARSASHAKELLEQRERIHEQERLIVSLRRDLEMRSQSVAKSDDKRRGIEGELANVRETLDEIEKQAVLADRRAARARDAAARAQGDKELAIRRGEDALRRLALSHERALADRDREHAATLEQRDRALVAQHHSRAADEEAHARVLGAERKKSADELAARERVFVASSEQQARKLATRERRHRAEIAAYERVLSASARNAAEELAAAAANLADVEKALAVQREELASSVAAHARDLASAKEKREEALAEQARGHIDQSRDRARAHANAVAEMASAHAEELALARAGVGLAMEQRLGKAEQSLASARARQEREAADWKLQVATLREAAAADRRLAEHAMALHASARAELAYVRRALDAAEREAFEQDHARDTLADVEPQPARTRDRLDQSGMRLTYAPDEEDDALQDAVTARMRA